MAKAIETLEQFYRNKYGMLSEDFSQNEGQFNVFKIEDRIYSGMTSPTFIRRDFIRSCGFRGIMCFIMEIGVFL
ncbi:hypothetical protein QWZ06_08740 [Chryseobacterium tructae]|uniref:hypothetical protein n=1 Tax=Chryseobacterium tructae TaxID=1037380 RepID=UPI0025B4DCB3|nr:hypothetical protein [Chryseobacterium tructae]MDN3692344.1 hypothetical protein [Chryseobacterium tructae]